MTRIPSRPTRYAGIVFRSRLEARWAAFFDLVGLEWDYEPFEIDRWIPDFLLPGKPGVLCEVKPITGEGDDEFRKAVQARIEHKLEVGQCEFPILLLGVGPTCDRLGWISDNEWDHAALTTHPGIATFWQSYHCRITGQYDGSSHEASWETVRAAWHEAGNQTRWRRPEEALPPSPSEWRAASAELDRWKKRYPTTWHIKSRLRPSWS